MYDNPTPTLPRRFNRHWLTATLICIVVTAGGASAALAQHVRSTLTTGAFSLTTGHTARVLVVDSGFSATPVPVTLELVNSKGTVVGTNSGFVRPGAPLSLSVTASSVLGRLSSVPVYVRAVALREAGDTGHAMIVSLEFHRNPTAPGVGPAVIIATSCNLGTGVPGGTAQGAEPNCGGCIQLNEDVP